MKFKISTVCHLLFASVFVAGCTSVGEKTPENLTTIDISIPSNPAKVDPMIYSQMLENVNDRVIYDGVVNRDGSERPYVNQLLKPLNIPVMRWPGGTVIHEYQWENGIGPLEERPTVDNIHWGGIENYRFGTDEFLQWCEKMDIEPYINFNMSNHPELGGSLQDALNWIEYVNGDKNTPYGKKRAANGREEPYNVDFWCIGNENWGDWGVHDKETPSEYAARLKEWASTILEQHPDLRLLGVGYQYEWDSVVLQENAELIDFLTQHYYVNAKVKDNQYQEPKSTLFAPAKVEAHLEKLTQLLEKANVGREDNPIRFSVDEWNNRHSVFDGEKFEFTRQDLRRQLDVAVVAGMLNVFIRQSPAVGMANYIFPVNGHGLIRTIGDDDAFITPIYHVFDKYREVMIGDKLEVDVNGPGEKASAVNINLAGDADEIDLGDEHLNNIDVAAVRNNGNDIHVAVVNRSPEEQMEFSLNIPEGYQLKQKWSLASPDIAATNTFDNQNNVKPTVETFNPDSNMSVKSISPCELIILQYVRED